MSEDDRDYTPVMIVCGRCGYVSSVSRYLIGPHAYPPVCLCGRYEWRFQDGTPIPFRLPDCEIAARLALGLYQPGQDMPQFQRSDRFDHALYGANPRSSSDP